MQAVRTLSLDQAAPDEAGSTGDEDEAVLLLYHLVEDGRQSETLQGWDFGLELAHDDGFAAALAENGAVSPALEAIALSLLRASIAGFTGCGKCLTNASSMARDFAELPALSYKSAACSVASRCTSGASPGA